MLSGLKINFAFWVNFTLKFEKLNLRARGTTDEMRGETQLAAQDCNGCYCTNRLSAIKINIVLEININSSSSADREEGSS